MLIVASFNRCIPACLDASGGELDFDKGDAARLRLPMINVQSDNTDFLPL